MDMIKNLTIEWTLKQYDKGHVRVEDIDRVSGRMRHCVHKSLNHKTGPITDFCRDYMNSEFTDGDNLRTHLAACLILGEDQTPGTFEDFINIFSIALMAYTQGIRAHCDDSTIRRHIDEELHAALTVWGNPPEEPPSEQFEPGQT